ncbi:STAS domain-containing protein [Actinoplanes hulinensis]|uniref:STAS domain-containing protein n=1 Tax=Actinoplanes hulinensis TaxID=1144547 RepID=A0ABS7BH55_9ACTN|nr:STAS domain-containing protein [Actinoplanes hulinensis]MBW6440213.1 STAS domain-containing protein [Actinoplanes hulinensis]
MGVVPVIGEHDGARITVRAMAGASVVRIIGDLDLAVATRLRTDLESAIARCPWVIVDLRGIGAVDSLGLGVLLAARESALRQAGDLLLAAAPPFFRSVLRAARIDAVFTTFDTVPQAVTRALAPRAAAGR